VREIGTPASEGGQGSGQSCHDDTPARPLSTYQGFFGHLKSEPQLDRLDLDEDTLTQQLDQYMRLYMSPLEFRQAFEARGVS
jgi:hypothetical protein